ncbi:MAG: GNAT family protein [Anaerolineales bacterium]
MKDIYTGDLTHLIMLDAKEGAKAFARWDRDSEFRRYLDSGAAYLISSNKIEKEIEEDANENSPRFYPFGVRALTGDTMIGLVDLFVYNWTGRDAFVGIGFGEREYWGKGYGADAMNLILRYAFTELNLRRVTLNVFEYNPRAIRSYEKVGFRHEGRIRQALNKEGKRWDMLFMGILRGEWMEQNDYKTTN